MAFHSRHPPPAGPNKYRRECYISPMPRAAFDLQAPFQPAGDQPKAIAELSRGLERDDVVIVATVSAIYGLGDPVQYKEQMVTLTRGQRVARDDILRSLVKIQYSRNDVTFERGTFRVRGDTVEIFPAYEEQGVRVEMWGDEVERISKINVLTRSEERRVGKEWRYRDADVHEINK